MFRRLTVAVEWDDVRDGESIAVNGACLTVADRGARRGRLRRRSARRWPRPTSACSPPGDSVHLERSLRVGDRIDGHFVQGHVDGTATLLRQASDDKEWRLVLEAPPELARYIVPKGSVALDGVSLTVAKVRGQRVRGGADPHDAPADRPWAAGPAGWPFNLEADILSKTVVAHLERHRGGRRYRDVGPGARVRSVRSGPPAAARGTRERTCRRIRIRRGSEVPRWNRIVPPTTRGLHARAASAPAGARLRPGPASASRRRSCCR